MNTMSIARIPTGIASLPRRRWRWRRKNRLLVLLSHLLLVQHSHLLLFLLKVETANVPAFEEQRTATQADMVANRVARDGSSSKRTMFSAALAPTTLAIATQLESTTAQGAETGLPDVVELAQSPQQMTTHTPSPPGGAGAPGGQPIIPPELRQVSDAFGAESPLSAASASSALCVEKEKVDTKSRRRHKRYGSPRRDCPCGRKRCFFFAESALVRSAGMLPPPPPFTPPPTLEGRAFLRAVELCRVARFNLQVGKRFVYLLSSAVTYFQQSRVKCAVAYAQMFREEDVPLVSEDVIDSCAVALLRYSPDECWIDIPDSRVVFFKGAPHTKISEESLPKVMDFPGDTTNKAAIESHRHLKRAERLTLTLFKFSLVSRCHWCPPHTKHRITANKIPVPELLPPEGYEGPKPDAWRKYLEALNAEVTRDLKGLRPPSSDEDDATSVAKEAAGGVKNASGLPTKEANNAQHAVSSSGSYKTALPWMGFSTAPVVNGHLASGEISRCRGPAKAGGYSGLGKIDAAAVFGGLVNPITRYAALLSYLQSRFQFRRLKYEFTGAEVFTISGDSSAGADLSLSTQESAMPPGAMQTVTFQKVDKSGRFGEELRSLHDIADGQRSFTSVPLIAAAVTSWHTLQRRSSCDLMPEDQAAEAAKAALACGADCVDTGEDLAAILRDGTKASPKRFINDTLWSQDDCFLRPVRRPRHPAADFLQRAYLNQIVAGCVSSRLDLNEAEKFHTPRGASLHFFSRFYGRCLQAMDEMTQPVFVQAFASGSRNLSAGVTGLQAFLSVPAPYSGADKLLVNCAAAGLDSRAMRPTLLSDEAASAEAIATAAAAAGAPSWQAPPVKTSEVVSNSFFAFHHPERALMGRSNFAPPIPCWDLKAARVPRNLSLFQYLTLVTTFANGELRAFAPAERHFLSRQLVPTVLQALLKDKLPMRIFAGYESQAARLYVLARYLRAKFRLDSPAEAGWQQRRPPTLSTEDQTMRAADVALACGRPCTDTGEPLADVVLIGLEKYRKGPVATETQEKTKEELAVEDARLDYDRGFLRNLDLEEPSSALEKVDEASPLRRKVLESRTRTGVSLTISPVEDVSDAGPSLQSALAWISAIATVSAIVF